MLTDFHDFGINGKRERGDPTYTMVANNYTLGVSISSSGGVVTTPLRKTLQKKAGRRGLKTAWPTKISMPFFSFLDNLLIILL